MADAELAPVPLEQIAAMALFLCSDLGASISGQATAVDVDVAQEASVQRMVETTVPLKRARA
jgi:enoyl-[acyl-carrier-protein] reductase (NADH)